MSKRVEKIEIDDEDTVNEKEQEQKRKEQELDQKTKNLLVYTLTTPIKAYGEEVRVIRFRRPTGMDIVMVGNPVVFMPHADPPRVEHDYPKLIKMMARLSDPPIPSTSLAEMDPQDLVGLAWTVSPFFTPAR